MIFTILNRERAHMFDSEKSYIVISITDPLSPNVVFLKSKTRKGILRLQFHDWTKSDKEKHEKELLAKGYIFFDMKIAKQIVEFVEKWKSKVEVIMIHCEAGISRSAAVGAALARWFYQSDVDFFKRYHPNDLVYQNVLYACYKIEEVLDINLMHGIFTIGLLVLNVV